MARVRLGPTMCTPFSSQAGSIRTVTSIVASRRAPGLVLSLGLLAGSVPGCVIDELREDEVGDAEACEAALRWPRGFGDREDELVALVNDVRDRGAVCAEVAKNPVPPLEVAGPLRCAARIHATDLAEGARLSHEGSDGLGTQSRVDRAGYEGLVRHEVMAADFTAPAEVLDAWLQSTAHCNALLDPGVTQMGVGHAQSFEGDAAAWVLLTGVLRDGS